MRAHEVKRYDSVLQTLSEPGCPICAFLKNVQARLIQEGNVAEFLQLCNAHAWAIAAVRQTETAAQIFLALISTRSAYGNHECSICLRLKQEEILRMQELLTALNRRPVVEWVKKHGVLCLPHGLKLRAEASIADRRLIDNLLEKRASELEAALRQLLTGASSGDSHHAGLLGRAAEFLVSQRGISLGHNVRSLQDVKG